MADLIALTSQPVTLTGNTNQNLWSAVEVPQCDMLDLELGVVATTGAMTGTLSIRLITGNQTLTDDASWLVVNPIFTDINLPSISVPYWTTQTAKMGFLRYLRWSLINWNLNGLSSVTFVIRGMARRYAQSSALTNTLGATIGLAPVYRAGATISGDLAPAYRASSGGAGGGDLADAHGGSFATFLGSSVAVRVAPTPSSMVSGEIFSDTTFIGEDAVACSICEATENPSPFRRG